MKFSTGEIATLISHIHTQTADFTNRMLSKKGSFVSSHGFILYLLSTEGKLSMSELASKINRTKSTTTVLVKKLSEEGLVKIEQNEEDSRVKTVSLTEKGLQYNDFTKEISSDLISTCYKNFSEEEKNTLIMLLEKLSSNLE